MKAFPFGRLQDLSVLISWSFDLRQRSAMPALYAGIPSHKGSH